MLKRSLISRTPLSDTFLESTVNKSSNQLHDMEYSLGRMNPSLNVKDYWKKKTKNIHLKLIFNKVNNMALYAVVNEDFVDLLCTFLRIPLGYIFNRFPCLSFEGCLGNLHKSIKETDISLFRSKEKKEILVNAKLAPGLGYNTNVIGTQEAAMLSHCSLSSLFYTNKWFINPMKKQENQSVFDSLIKGPAIFLVTDSLEVKPLSPISVKGFVDDMGIPLSDIGEQEVFLDEEKAMHLLSACVASDHALTSTFLSKEKNSNCLDFLHLFWERMQKLQGLQNAARMDGNMYF
ncbi:Rho1 guanine nucleotide exchange factor like protein [Tanacetum coccineum]